MSKKPPLPAAKVRDRITRFTPTSLSPEAWQAALPSVSDAVAAARPTSEVEAACLASRLCWFLARLALADWDRESLPDLDALLTETAAIAACSSVALPVVATRRTFRRDLTRLARAVHGRVIRRLTPEAKAPLAGYAFWPHVIDLGPFTSLVDAYKGGAALHGATWTGGLAEKIDIDLGVLLKDQAIVADQGAAGSREAGNLAAIRTAAATLRAVTAPPLGVSPVSAASSSQGSSNAPVQGERRTSGTAARRHALAKVAAAASASPVPSVAEVALLPAQLASSLASWSPQGMSPARWAAISDTVQTAVTAFAPTTKSSMGNCRPIISAFAWWAYARPDRGLSTALQPGELLASDLVDCYIAGPLRREPDASRATVRAVLRRVVRNLTPGPGPERIGHIPVQGPYSAADESRCVSLARNQPTRALRRSLSATVALGLGAGFCAEDQKPVAPCDVHEVDLGEHGTALAVTAADGRTVIVRDEYAPLLREALAIHAQERRGPNTPMCGVKLDRRNGANRVAANAVTATGVGVDISAARLRATWLVACMSAPVPLGALLHAAGLRTPRTLADLLPYCPPADPVVVALALAVAKSAIAISADDAPETS